MHSRSCVIFASMVPSTHSDPLILTASSRLARWLHLQHNTDQAQSGDPIWQTPAIHALDFWLKEIWLQSWPQQYVLTNLQSQKLWEQIARRDPETSQLDLLHLRGAAAQAAQAYTLINQYRIPVLAEQYTWTQETISFHRWLKTYRKKLKEWHALDSSEMLDAVREAMKRGDIATPDRIELAGFDEITPQLNTWLDLLRDHQTKIEFNPNPEEADSPQDYKTLTQGKEISIFKILDQRQEAVQCARWVRSVFKKGETVGIIVPDLENYRSVLLKEMRAELDPESVYPWRAVEAPFNLSLGSPLSQESMIHQALMVLSLDDATLSFSDFSNLLTSRFLKGDKDEQEARLTLDTKLRNGNTTRIALDRFIKKYQNGNIPIFISVIGAIQNWRKEHWTQTPSQWARRVAMFLKELGWPFSGEETLNSVQYQTWESWNACLDDLASLDRMVGKVGRPRAIALLTQIAEEKVFQPKTREEPIQILDESSGMKFDHLWIMGCHSDTLPGIPRPNPFIPFHLQKGFELPHSTAERELQFAEQIFHKWLASSDHIVFSYPNWEGDKELTLSPLLKCIGEKPALAEQASSHRVIDRISALQDLEIYKDATHVAIHPEEKELIGGGSSLLKNQAECPFRAFAVHRLGARDFKIPEVDMTGAARGILVHNILESFWRKVRSSKTLHELQSNNKLKDSIRKCVEKELNAQPDFISQSSYFYQMETERLTELLQEWMEQDLARPEFKVLWMENQLDLEVAGLKLKLRIDRMDQTEDGNTILIDYKTGKTSTSGWFHDRIQEPQLPLYHMQSPAGTVLFAEVRKGNCSYKGVAQSANGISGIAVIGDNDRTGFSSWSELTSAWEISLQALAQEFLDGLTSVQPFNKNLTCRNCHLATLCRKDESYEDLGEEDE